ncbi:type II secretion system protein E [Paractinoplanes abujensis]|uniref:Pilus assembly protein CpaF n=1 Tax=Paractinoplanes abujensis TaxID=882441 RepID=A0A7W7CL53_9ACTN|nr:CpaF family protein [Actinoplanes abujensis]MBB4690570.1 pilus assembly protein CpaF [Actinoplanes abujensis]GID18016.1 type II secretion system protein E [Actinoplanes abujensis]
MSLSARLGMYGNKAGGAEEDNQEPIEELPGRASATTQRYRAAGRQAVDPVYDVRLRIQRRLADELGPTLYASRGNDEALDARVREVLFELLAREETPLSGGDRARIIKEVTDEVLGHGPIETLLRDPSVTEVMANGAKSIYVERFGRLERTEVEFDDDAHLRRIIDRICARVGRRVDEASPMVDARLPDGSRVNAIVPPIALDGASLTIRKFSATPLTVGDLISYGTMTRPAAEFLEASVRGRRNVLVSGGTGSGKTTILNVLSDFVPADERIVTIEDAAELRLGQDHVVRLESRPSNAEGRGTINTRDLVKNALRMRPDRIVVGEVRDAAALDMLQAMNTGHDGSLTTLHANTPRDALSRLETMVLMAGMDLPSRAIRDQIASAVDLVIQITRFKDGSRKVTHITEVVGMEGDTITLQDLFLYDLSAETPVHLAQLRPTGIRPRFVDALAMYGVTLPAGMFGGPKR